MKNPSPREKIEKILRKYFPKMDGEGMFSLILELEEVEQESYQRGYEKSQTMTELLIGSRLDRLEDIEPVKAYKDKLREKIDETIGEIADDGFKSYQDGWEDALKHVLKLLDEGE